MCAITRCFSLAKRFTDSFLKEGSKVALKRAGNKFLEILSDKGILSSGRYLEYKEVLGYRSVYQSNEIISGKPTVKAIAFYLPQFHSFPENDLWWGKGFTEWTNTRKALPLFKGHYQPREPHDDIGYYNLANVETLKKQVKLAQEHHIFGFCFYYYWFSGHCLMEKPLDLFLGDPDIDFPFCLCWANDSWTKRWACANDDILIKQEYNLADRELFILDIKKYLLDPRYIRVNGKPVIIVYNPGNIPNVKSVFRCWKKTAKQCGIGEISIWIVRSFTNTIHSLELEELVDREIEFPPHAYAFVISRTNKQVKNNRGSIFDYVEFVRKVLESRTYNNKIYRTVMLGWDNSARMEKGYAIYDHFDLKTYYDWLRANVVETEKTFNAEERFIFINAWNEWGEGTYLEPDKRYGYTNLNVTTRAILNKPFEL